MPETKRNNRLVSLIRRSVKKMRDSTFYHTISYMKNYHFNIINDKAYFFEDTPLKNKMVIFKNLIIFNSAHPFVIAIKLIAFIQLLLLFFYSPFEASFAENISFSTKATIKGFAFSILTLESLFKMNTSYFSNGLLITQRSKILMNYCKNCLITDLICFSAMINNDNENIYIFFRLNKLLVFIKGYQFKQMYNELVQYFNLEIRFKGCQEIFELFCVSVFLAHFIACLWHLSALFSMNYAMEPDNWLINNHLINATWNTRYLYSLYWAVVVMMTVGFGDITPTNNFEITFCIVAIFTGCALFAYNLNSIGILLQKIYKDENEFKEQERVINNFMERKKIDSGLQSRIKEYLKFLWNEKKTQHTAKEIEIINTLSSSLKEELLLESYGGIIKAFPILHKKFSEKTLKSMITCIKEIRFVPGDYIYNVSFWKNI